MGYMLLSHWPKRPHGNFQTSQAISKATVCSPQTDGLLKTIFIDVTEHREMELVPLPLLTNGSGTGMYPANYQRKITTILAANPEIYHGDLSP